MSQEDDLFPPDLDDNDSDWASGLDDGFDDLRQQSSMSTDVYGDMEMVEESSGGSGLLSRLNPLQKLILALLFLVLVVVYGAAALLAVGLLG